MNHNNLPEWEDGVEYVDTRQDLEEDQDECETCGATMASTLAITESEGSGPAYVCLDCGRVDRI
jgi:hypothetical protein